MSAYDLFTKLMDKAVKLQDEHSTPLKALLHVIRQEISEESAQQLVPIFKDWLEGYTWNKVFSGSIPDISYSWEQLTVRLLKRDIARVSIQLASIEDKPRLNAEALVLLWSKTNPNLYDNIKQALSHSKINDAIWKELENFDKQINTSNIESDVLKNIFRKLLVADAQITDYDEQRKWMEAEASASFPMLTKENLSKITSNVSMMLPDNPRIPFTFDQTKYKTNTFEELKKIVEQRRLEVKESKWQLKVFRTALRQLGQRKRERLNESDWSSKWTAEQWVTTMTLQEIPKQLVPEEKIRENLRKLDLPENMVSADKRFGKTRYTIPENAKEEAEIKNRNMLVEARRKYVRLLQPEVKRIKKELSLEIEVTPDFRPSIARVSYRHWDWSGKEMPSAVRSIFDWCKARGFEIETTKHGFSAELTIQIAQCVDTKDMKRKISNALL
jgi:hypothetical protein